MEIVNKKQQLLVEREDLLQNVCKATLNWKKKMFANLFNKKKHVLKNSYLIGTMIIKTAFSWTCQPNINDVHIAITVDRINISVAFWLLKLKKNI